jgi:hypothetical protein
MPRNLFIPLDVEPINVPLSSVTVIEGIVLLANTVETTAHKIKRGYLRSPILGDENCSLGQTRRKNAGQDPNERRF